MTILTKMGVSYVDHMNDDMPMMYCQFQLEIFNDNSYRKSWQSKTE